MKKIIVKQVVRSRLAWQSVTSASAEAEKWRDAYLKLGEALNANQGTESITVPEMLGVDAEMTNWSFYQLLAHNTIVNQAMTRNVKALMTGEGLEALKKFNPKTDVLPEVSVGEEQMALFAESVQNHLDTVAQFGHLKSQLRNDHPVFGSFDAHMWHGMFGFHLKVHFKQAEMIVEKALKG